MAAPFSLLGPVVASSGRRRAVSASAWLALPKPLLLAAGAFCLAWAVVVGLAARSPAPSRAGLRAIIALNLLWVVDSVVLLVTGWVTPSELGLAFVLAQAAAVLAFVGLQTAGLGRSVPAAA